MGLFGRKPRKQASTAVKKNFFSQTELNESRVWARNVFGPGLARRIRKAQAEKDLVFIAETTGRNKVASGFLLETPGLHFEIKLLPNKVTLSTVKFRNLNVSLADIVKAKHSIDQLGREKFVEELKKKAKEMQSPERKTEEYRFDPNKKDAMLHALKFAIGNTLIEIEKHKID